MLKRVSISDGKPQRPSTKYFDRLDKAHRTGERTKARKSASHGGFIPRFDGVELSASQASSVTRVIDLESTEDASIF